MGTLLRRKNYGGSSGSDLSCNDDRKHRASVWTSPERKDMRPYKLIRADLDKAS
jgi:hypothetical protein